MTNGSPSSLAPTYSGCPATEVIEQSVVGGARSGGVADVRSNASAVAAVDDRLDQRRRP